MFFFFILSLAVFNFLIIWGGSSVRRFMFLKVISFAVTLFAVLLFTVYMLYQTWNRHKKAIHDGEKRLLTSYNAIYITQLA